MEPTDLDLFRAHVTIEAQKATQHTLAIVDSLGPNSEGSYQRLSAMLI